MVAPAEGEVGPTVNEEYSGPGGRCGLGKHIVVVYAVEENVVVLNAGIGGGELVRCHCEYWVLMLWERM